ncbi:MAG: 6-pyruvoyl tetrahydrobiopterin synthase [Bacteroidota bacterium]|nr:6-pyruvoyl tetrahydrobiopterin synthase [Bacteroidota bacterium]
MIYLTRRETFNAAHRLYNDGWSEEANDAVFGKCANKNWHGHNYALFVTVKGEPNPETGFIINVKELSTMIKEKVVDRLDHTNLNLDVDFIPKDIHPTTENLVRIIWQQLDPHIKGCKLHSIKLYETENIYAEYFGE